MQIKDPHQCYHLLLTGIYSSGEKAGIVIKGIQPFFDIKVPDGSDADVFSDFIAGSVFGGSKNQAENIYLIRHEIVMATPFKGFQESKSKYMRCYFNTTSMRTKAIKRIVGQTIEIPVKSQLVAMQLDTASDDTSCYYRKVAREAKIKLCGWNIVSKYTIDKSKTFCRPAAVREVLLIKLTDISDLKNTIDPHSDPKKYAHLLKDKTMIGNWDLETDSENPTGHAPLPENVFNKDTGEAEDVIRMYSMSYFWYWSDKPLLKINITDMPAKPRADCLIVVCKDQIDIIRISSYIIGRMCPEFYAGFNDGTYDWPFIIKRAEQYDEKFGTGLIQYMKECMSVIPWSPEADAYTIVGSKTEKVKIEAERMVENVHFSVPGMICFDVRTIFQQLYPTADKSSLSFYLAANKLGSKEDMAYQKMFKIFRLMRQLAKMFGTSDKNNDVTQNVYDKILTGLYGVIAQHGEKHQPLLNHREVNIYRNIDDSKYNAHQLTVKEIIDLVEESEQVIHYCNIDAQRCQDLLKMRSIIPDRREMGDLSYTSMHDAIYRAGGMKVRNLVISEGIKPEWNIALSNISRGEKDPRKYPGAYVVPPKKGLYRDHTIVKRARRSAMLTAHNISIGTDMHDILVRVKDELTRADFDERYPMTASEQINNDTNGKIDRPCAGLDFSSLYPSLMMAYNFSPEMIVLTYEQYEMLKVKLDRYGRLYRFVEIEFLYGLKDEAESSKEKIHGWCVQHTPIEGPVIGADGKPTGKTQIVKFEGMGLYPSILKRLFDQRALMKKRMEYFQVPKEFLEKVFETKRLTELLKVSIGEQMECVRAALLGERNARQTELDTFKEPYYKWRLSAMKELDHFFEKEWFAAENKISVGELYDEMTFQYNYLNVKQNALKVFMNTFYGEAGNSQSAFFLPHVAGGTTTYGVKNLKKVIQHTEEAGFSVKYGDSVLPNTPILIKRGDVFMYRKIEDLASDWSEVDYGDGLVKEHAECAELTYVWSDAGWTQINKVIRHKTNKDIYRVLTHTGCVDVTEDHSLLSPDGAKVRPSECMIGTELMHYDLPKSTVCEKFRFSDDADMIPAEMFYMFDRTDPRDRGLVKLTNLGKTGGFVYDLSTENHHFAAGVGHLIVHNTDSAYISPPEKYYEAADADYVAGKITKKEYWTQMIKISMEVLDKYKDEIGDMLFKNNGTRFLKMAYEEILWPYAMVGKKKYVGIQHQNIVNLRACMSECPLDEFIKSKSLFIKGLEIKKRGPSKFMTLICYEILKEAFCIDTTKTLKEIVEVKLKDVAGRKFAPDLFIRSAAYKLPGKNKLGVLKRGNVTVLQFAGRMRDLDRKHPELGIKAPELGERFQYIVSKKYPWQYGLRGTKSNTSIGDKYEYFTSLENKEYHNMLQGPIEIDIDYYITHELIGQFSRFLIYHPDYNTFFNESMYDDDAAYKVADKKARDFAKHELVKYYEKNFATSYMQKGNIYKDIFNVTNGALRGVMLHKYGDIVGVFDVVNTLVTGADTSEDDGMLKFDDVRLNSKISDKLRGSCSELGKKQARSNVSALSVKTGMSVSVIRKLYTDSRSNVLNIRKAQLVRERSELDALFIRTIPEFKKYCLQNVAILETVTSEIKSQSEIETFNFECDDEATQLDIGLTLDQEEVRGRVEDVMDGMGIDDSIVHELNMIYAKLVSVERMLTEIDLMEMDFKANVGRQVGYIANPFVATNKKYAPIAQRNMIGLKTNFMEWLDRNRDK